MAIRIEIKRLQQHDVVKTVAEIPMDGVAPAVGNAIMDVCGADLSDPPATLDID